MNSELLTTIPALILLLPLAAAVVLIFFGRRLPRQGDWLAIGVMAVCFVLSLVLFKAVIVDEGANPETYARWSFPWITLGGVTLSMGFLIDNLSAIMTVVVCGLCTAVFVYSIFYMRGDKATSRYYAKFSFFAFAMLGVVLSENLLMTFIFWELVGLGSYFLIGFWYEKDAVTDVSGLPLSPAFAQKKAFVVNRVGDFGFMCGMGLLMYMMLSYMGQDASVADSPLSFSQLFHAMSQLGDHAGPFSREIHLFGAVLEGETALTLATILIFMGAMGKSAQFPLHIWLPDAMQGPTTVSSIIHAATMVAAGVFMTARIHPMLPDGTLVFIGFIGGFTAFLAATMAMVQWDIKAVLAYSTISQLGYMMLGLGAGGLAMGLGYTYGIAHLFTHAFFKCMLFLCAGAVIHACHHEQNMFKMGGLRSKMPWTYAAMLAGTLAISGVPLFSGFFSKDGILASSLTAAMWHHPAMWIPWALGMVTAVLTCFYMFRLIFLTFHGKPRDAHIHEHAHDPSPFKVGVLPLIVLMVFTLGFWWSGQLGIALPGLSVDATVHGKETSQGWLVHAIQRPDVSRFARLDGALNPIAAAAKGAHGTEEIKHFVHVEHTAHWIMLGLSLAAVLLGLYLAMRFYFVRSIDKDALEDEEGFRAWALRKLSRFIKPTDPDEMLARYPVMKWLFGSASKLWGLDMLFSGLVVRFWKKVNDLSKGFDDKVIDQGLVDMGSVVTVRLTKGTGWFDDNVVDKLVDSCGWIWKVLGMILRHFQAGRIQGYAFWTVAGLASVILAVGYAWWAGVLLFVGIAGATFAGWLVAEFRGS